MADPVYPAAPQAFTFRGRRLVGQIVGFSGTANRRAVVHEFPKRKGAIVEDMERAPRRLDVRLEFLGDTCAKDFADFAAAVDSDPVGLLVHPIAGNFPAFCVGPNEDVDLSRAVNEIRVRVQFIETALDRAVEKDVPDVATAAQRATAQDISMQQAIALYMGEIAALEGKGMAQIQAALTLAEAAANPITVVQDAVRSIAGVSSSLVRSLNRVAALSAALSTSVSSYVSQATDLFNGSEVEAGTASAIDTLLGTVQAAAEALQAELIASAGTPAGAGESSGEVDESVSACLVLSEALKAEKPPLVLYVVPELTDVISIAVLLYPGDSAAARASELLGLNRIPNPAAIPAGTQLLRYAS